MRQLSRDHNSAFEMRRLTLSIRRPRMISRFIDPRRHASTDIKFKKKPPPKKFGQLRLSPKKTKEMDYGNPKHKYFRCLEFRPTSKSIDSARPLKFRVNHRRCLATRAARSAFFQGRLTTLKSTKLRQLLFCLNY